jgi:hypothetical protein
MSETNAQGQSQERTPQGSVTECQAQSGGVGGTENPGGFPRDFSERTDRAFGTRAELLCADTWNLFVGGILAQLISDSETRLGEAIECIDWYERVRQRETARLASLRSLAADAALEE